MEERRVEATLDEAIALYSTANRKIQGESIVPHWWSAPDDRSYPPRWKEDAMTDRAFSLLGEGREPGEVVAMLSREWPTWRGLMGELVTAALAEIEKAVRREAV